MKRYRSIIKYGSPAAALAGAATIAQAALPTAVSDMFTAVQTDVGSAFALGWVLFGVVTGGLVIFSVVKKVISKSV